MVINYADISSKVRGLKFDIGLHLHPDFTYAGSEGSDKSAHMPRLA